VEVKKLRRKKRGNPAPKTKIIGGRRYRKTDSGHWKQKNAEESAELLRKTGKNVRTIKIEPKKNEFFKPFYQNYYRCKK